MGMGGGSGEDMINDINVTPLVDVCLVLVIIFMAVSPFGLQTGINVLQQKAKAAVGKVAESDTVTVKLTKQLKLTIDGKPVSFEALGATLRARLDGTQEKMVIVTADEQNVVEHVVKVMDTAKQAGAKKLAIMMTEPPKAAGGGGR